jgi:glutamyl-tRNA reductase
MGAGEMGEGMVRSLATNGVTDIRIANRTWERAADLAERVGGRAIRLVDLDASLAEVDLLLTGTGASSMLIEHADVARVMQVRDGAPLLVVDVAVPRDVDPTASDLPGVTLLDMDDLRAFAEAGQAERRREVAGVRTMVGEELDRYMGVSSAREVAPLVAALRDQADAVRRAELDRYRAKLGELDERQLEAVEALTHGIVAKLLHQPTIGLKDAAGTPKGERLAEALRDLFDL